MWLQHPQPKQRKIVFHWVLRVEGSEALGELEHSQPIGLFSSQQPHSSRHSFHMHIERDEQLCGLYFFPKAKIHARRILPHHPSEKHIEAFASGAACGSGHMFACAFRRVGISEEMVVKTPQRLFHRVVAGR